MSHVADPRALTLVTDITNATSVAGRLRQLEVMATKIMDAALQPTIKRYYNRKTNEWYEVEEGPDGRLALAALKEVRATLHEMSALTETLAGQHEAVEERPDIDNLLNDFLRGKMVGPDDPAPADDEPAGAAPTAPPEPDFMRELLPGNTDDA